MYMHKMAVAIKTNGQILREHGDTVVLPFGSEYSVFVKNLNNKRAIVSVTIDGNDVIAGGLVIDANSEVDLQRSVVSNNLTDGRCFKFIERIAAIERHRGIKIDDGIIRVSFKYEKLPVVLPASLPTTWGNLTYPPGVRGFTGHTPYPDRFTLQSSGVMVCGTATSRSSNISATVSPQSANDVGITVPGSASTQRFVVTDGFVTEPEEYVLILRLTGETLSGIPVAHPITVKSKKQCASCGTVFKAVAKYCANCGTHLSPM